MIAIIRPASDSQPFDHSAISQMFLNYFVDVFLIYIRIPDIFRIDHNNWTLVAAIKTARGVDPYSFALAVEFQRLDTFLGVITHCLSTVIVTAHRSRFALVDAEKYMPLVVAHKKTF